MQGYPFEWASVSGTFPELSQSIPRADHFQVLTCLLFSCIFTSLKVLFPAFCWCFFFVFVVGSVLPPSDQVTWMDWRQNRNPFFFPNVDVWRFCNNVEYDLLKDPFFTQLMMSLMGNWWPTGFDCRLCLFFLCFHRTTDRKGLSPQMDVILESLAFKWKSEVQFCHYSCFFEKCHDI